MPRGRHRHSPPLHRLLPPSAVAGASVLCAAGAWFLAEPMVLRSLVAAAAAAAVTGAVLMRSWDRSAGRRVAELTRARESDQWKTEERIAELETDVEESRELRAKLDAKLRAKRVELAALRGEHAALLRRYATAETERATALEGRRQLALEAAAPAKALLPAGPAPTPATYLRAAKALENLSRNAAAQEAKRTVEEARRHDLAERAREADEPQGKHAAAAGGEQHTRPSSALPARRPVPAAATIVPYGPRRRPAKRPEGGFDFFGTGNGDGTTDADGTGTGTGTGNANADGKADGEDAGAGTQKAIEAVQNEDLADVVGEEALAAAQRPAVTGAVGKVIDLTAHDETEQMDVVELRSAIS
ncbi:hypothetical protein OG883_00745 [Streptomyces sp. NBC_01142]|uniref:hypothetical protein n=1 Tax=Streptomyces sp. NBC_01142 TaxID=2975865 RepID=UPI002258F662|nr:hypothetical protein [Streptomyces sp. NBC_01142]MCX4818458.1 hypothetical protein [Streptomyces sp. NBC_01142]